MPTIKISKIRSGACNPSLDYACGKDKLSDSTKRWLKNNGIDEHIINDLKDRSVIKGGNNLVNPNDLSQVKWEYTHTRKMFHNKEGSPEGQRFIQSFDTDELSPINPNDWYRCNEMGIALAKKIAPDNEVAVYTQLDGKGHKLHNHLIMGANNLINGKKYHHNHDFMRVRNLNDEVSLEYGIVPLSQKINQQHDRRNIAERNILSKGQYSWTEDLRRRINTVMEDSSISSIKDFNMRLQKMGVSFHDRKRSSSYSFLDKNQKARRIRGKRLGSSYTKETIFNELGRRQLQIRTNQGRLSDSLSNDSIAEKDYRQARFDHQNETKSHSKTSSSYTGYGKAKSTFQKRTAQVKWQNQNFRPRHRRLVPRMEHNVNHVENRRNQDKVWGLEAIANAVEKSLRSSNRQIQSEMNQANYAMNEYIRHEKELEQQEAQDEAEKAKQDRLEQEKQDEINQYYHFHGPSW